MCLLCRGFVWIIADRVGKIAFKTAAGSSPRSRINYRFVLYLSHRRRIPSRHLRSYLHRVISQYPPGRAHLPPTGNSARVRTAPRQSISRDTDGRCLDTFEEIPQPTDRDLPRMHDHKQPRYLASQPFATGCAPSDKDFPREPAIYACGCCHTIAGNVSKLPVDVVEWANSLYTCSRCRVGR